MERDEATALRGATKQRPGLHKADRTTISCIMRIIERNANDNSEVLAEKARILERIEITKAVFRTWLVSGANKLPQFWFDEIKRTKRVTLKWRPLA